MTTPDPYLIMGIVGMVFILAAFLLNQLRVWTQDMLIYDVCNAVGGLLLVVYAIDGRAWPFVVLNGVWTLYSVRDVVIGLK